MQYIPVYIPIIPRMLTGLGSKNQQKIIMWYRYPTVLIITVLRIRIRIRIRIHRIHVFLGLQDPVPDPLVRGMDPDPDPALDLDPEHHAKIVRKTLIPTFL